MSRHVPEIVGSGSTDAETVEGGSRDNPRSMILSTAPACARASYHFNTRSN